MSVTYIATLPVSEDTVLFVSGLLHAQQFTTASGRWLPLSAGGVVLFNPTSVKVIRYRYRGNKIPSPYKRLNHA